MKRKFLILLLCLFSFSLFAMNQAGICSVCHKPLIQCKGHTTPPPAPSKCSQCGKTNCRTKNNHKVCGTCGQYDFKCNYKLNHPCSQCGMKDCKRKDMHEKCPTCGEYDFNCSYNFNHPCSQCGKKDCKKKDKHEKCLTCREYDLNCQFHCHHPEFVDLGLSVKWATYNVGATCPEEYGDYFAWGETTPKEVYDWSTYKWCSNDVWYGITKYTIKDGMTGSNWYKRRTFVGDNKAVLDPEDDAAHINWGGAWRMPNYEELRELREHCTWTWITQNGTNGYKVVGPNGNSIFLPAAGKREYSSLSRCVGSCGHYWLCRLKSDSGRAGNLHFKPEGVDAFVGVDGDRNCGFSVRPVHP